MTQLDLVKSFLEDTEIQQKYGLSPTEVAQLTMNSQYNTEKQMLVSLIRQMVSLVEDSSITINLAASRLNVHLENALR